MQQSGPLLTTPQSHQRGVDLTLLLCTAGALLAGFGLEAVLDADGAAVIIGVASALTFAAIFLLIPRRYEVWSDRLEVVFPWRRWRIPLDTISLVRPAPLLSAYAYVGLRFATAPSKSVEVKRVDGHLLRPDLVISPEGREEFLRVANAALDGHRLAD